MMACLHSTGDTDKYHAKVICRQATQINQTIGHSFKDKWPKRLTPGIKGIQPHLIQVTRAYCTDIQGLVKQHCIQVLLKYLSQQQIGHHSSVNDHSD